MRYLPRPLTKCLLALALLGLCHDPIGAVTTYTWEPPVSSDYKLGTAANWSPATSVPPPAGSNIIFPATQNPATAILVNSGYYPNWNEVTFSSGTHSYGIEIANDNGVGQETTITTSVTNSSTVSQTFLITQYYYTSSPGGLTFGANCNLNIGTSKVTYEAQGATITFAGSTSGTGTSGSGYGFINLKQSTATPSIVGMVNTTTNTTVTVADLVGDATSIVNLASGCTFGFGGANLNSTFAGIFQGAGGIQKNGSGTETLTNLNTFSGPTTIADGTLAAGITNAFSPNSAVTIQDSGILLLNGYNNTIPSLASTSTSSKVHLNGATLTIASATPQTTTFDGVIGSVGDFGSLVLNGNNVLTLANANLYSGTTTINNGTLILAHLNDTIANSSAVSIQKPGILELGANNIIRNLTGGAGAQVQLNSYTLTINQSTPIATFAGNISGTNGMLILDGSSPLYTLVLTGTNTYSGGTLINEGTLQGNTNSLQGSINVNGNTLIFDQTFNGTFQGTLSGASSSVVDIDGPGTVSFNTSQATYTGLTNVNSGRLNLNSTIGGSVVVNAGGTFGGNGTVAQNLTVNTAGTISPGNNIGDTVGTINVLGNYVQAPNSTYAWEGDLAGQGGLINVSGTAMIAGDFVYNFTDAFRVNQQYTVLAATNGVSGTYNPISNISPFMLATLNYNTNDVYFTVQTDLESIALTHNQEQVAEQIDSIVNPNDDQADFLASFVGLTVEQAQEALDTISGDQYTYLLQMARYSNERLKNSIYNSIRELLDPCWLSSTCDVAQSWSLAQFGQFYAKGDDNCAGLNGTTWDVTFGTHFPIFDHFLVGVAGSYQSDHINFYQGGKTTRQTGQAAIYAGGRNSFGYAFAEAIYGATTGGYRRPIHFGTTYRAAKSTPKSTQGLLYGEAGLSFNFTCPCSLLLQPFVGFEYGHYNQGDIAEKRADSLKLHIRRVNKTNFDFLMGLHFTGGLADLILSADVAWQHRFDPYELETKNYFENFGEEMYIKGCKYGNNGVRGNIQALYEINDRFEIYSDANVEAWERWISYGIDIGVSAWW